MKRAVLVLPFFVLVLPLFGDSVYKVQSRYAVPGDGGFDYVGIDSSARRGIADFELLASAVELFGSNIQIMVADPVVAYAPPEQFVPEHRREETLCCLPMAVSWQAGPQLASAIPPR